MNVPCALLVVTCIIFVADETTAIKNPIEDLVPRRHIREASVASSQICNCGGLTCTCCVSLDPGVTNPSTGCLHATYVPSDFKLDVNIEANGQSVYTTKIDSGNFPICATAFPPACWAFNRIHIDQNGAQFCSEIRLGPVTLLKVPCLTYAGDSLIATPNNY